MRKYILNPKVILIACMITALFSSTASAYWIWTPETKKFVNPKYAVKDSPKEQFDWAMSFYNAKDFQRAAAEFEKLVKHYEYSEYASDAQYYIGLSYENMAKFYTAFQNYQKAVDNFPHIENLDEIIAREFNIANFYATKDSPKVLGMDIMTALDRAIEIYKKVVDNAPYGKLADEAQFKMGEALKKAERYDEAIQAFQKVVDDYANSKFADKSRYEVAYCAYKASLKPAYDIESTDKAIKAFQEFSEANRDRDLSKEADKTVQRLKDRAAEKSLSTARFYESQKHYPAAVIYYQDVIDRFPDSSFVAEAKAKVEKLSAISKNQRAISEGGAKTWNPIKFTTQPKPKEASAPSAANNDKTENKKAWAPFSFAKKAKSSGSVAAKEEPKSQKKGWAPLSFTRPAKIEAAEDSGAPKAIRLVGWKPLNFTQRRLKENIAQAEAAVVQTEAETKQEEKETKAEPLVGLPPAKPAPQETGAAEESVVPSAEVKTGPEDLPGAAKDAGMADIEAKMREPVSSEESPANIAEESIPRQARN